MQLLEIAVMPELASDSGLPPGRDGSAVLRRRNRTFGVILLLRSLVDPQTIAWLSGLGRAAEGLSRDQRNVLALMR
jgi:hypothetical protein